MLKIHNTLKRKKESFHPIKPNQVGMYVCGITVYDYCHIGHARTYVSVDVILRYLRFRGLKVNYVRNITDIDDKIIKRAQENNEPFDALTKRFIAAMYEDFDALKLLPPDHEPRATDYIPKMIKLIEQLIAKAHAYVAKNGDVYFDVRSYPDYGALSHHDIEQLEHGARVEINEAKKDPLDFVLWKLAKPGEPSWASPWGEGRPGWHIECSAMAMDLLGQTFDLHLGARDLIFPHHENEIAQSQAATGQTFVNMWMHGGFLQIEKEKMSKSLGNFVTIRDVLAKHPPEVLRYMLMSSHYRSPVIYSEDLLVQAKLALTRFYTALRFHASCEPAQYTIYEKGFIAAMDDDFNVPVALSVLFELAHEIERLREGNPEEAAKHSALLQRLGDVLGILQTNPEAFFQSGDVDAAVIDALIAEREQARASKNWARADEIRQQLAAMSITLEDGPKGTTWKTE